MTTMTTTTVTAASATTPSRDEMVLEMGGTQYSVSTLGQALALCQAVHSESVVACDEDGEWTDLWLYASAEDAVDDYHGHRTVGVLRHATPRS